MNNKVIKIVEGDENVQVGGYRFPKITSMERYESEGHDSLRGAIVKYKEHIIITEKDYTGVNVVVIYEFVDTPEETGFDEIECRLNLIEVCDKGFNDSGSALEWAFKKLK